MNEKHRVVGVDAAGKLGWVGVVLVDGRFEEAIARPSLAEIVADADAVQVVAVDMPIGQTATGIRAADGAARTFIRPRGSCVFSTAPFEVWSATDFDSANAWLGENNHKKISRQTWALLPKMNECDVLARADDRI